MEWADSVDGWWHGPIWDFTFSITCGERTVLWTSIMNPLSFQSSYLTFSPTDICTIGVLQYCKQWKLWRGEVCTRARSLQYAPHIYLTLYTKEVEELLCTLLYMIGLKGKRRACSQQSVAEIQHSQWSKPSNSLVNKPWKSCDQNFGLQLQLCISYISNSDHAVRSLLPSQAVPQVQLTALLQPLTWHLKQLRDFNLFKFTSTSCYLLSSPS